VQHPCTANVSRLNRQLPYSLDLTQMHEIVPGVRLHHVSQRNSEIPMRWRRPDLEASLPISMVLLCDSCLRLFFACFALAFAYVHEVQQHRSDNEEHNDSKNCRTH